MAPYNNAWTQLNQRFSVLLLSINLMDHTGQGKNNGLLTKRAVKMVGYLPSSFCACLWTETKSSSINTQEKERSEYPAILTEQAWSIKDYKDYYME